MVEQTGKVTVTAPATALPVISNISVNASGKPVLQFDVSPTAARSSVSIVGRTFQFSCTSGARVVCECTSNWAPALKGNFTAQIESFDAAGRSSGVKQFGFTR